MNSAPPKNDCFVCGCPLNQGEKGTQPQTEPCCRFLTWIGTSHKLQAIGSNRETQTINVGHVATCDPFGGYMWFANINCKIILGLESKEAWSGPPFGLIPMAHANPTKLLGEASPFFPGIRIFSGNPQTPTETADLLKGSMAEKKKENKSSPKTHVF